jgi:hypothetical protein
LKYKKIRNIEPNSQEINLLGIKKEKNILVGIKKNILVQVLNCRRQFKKWV